MKKLAVISVIFLTLILACSPKMMVETGSFTNDGYYDRIPYHLASHKKSVSKLILHLPTQLDTFSFHQSEIHKELFKRGYNILTINKGTTANFYLRKAYDYKDQRLQDILNTYRWLLEQNKIGPKKLVILGIGEGAYLASETAVALDADSVIFVNGGPFSELLEMELSLTGKDSLNPIEKDFYKRNFEIDSLAQLKTALYKVKKTGADSYSLGGNRNIYWISYNQDVLGGDYKNMRAQAIWINFENYPLYKQSSFNYLKVLGTTRMQAKNEYLFLNGDGNLSTKENQKELQQMLGQILD